MKRIAIVAVMILAGALWLVASSQGGSDHARWPLDSHVKTVSQSELRLGRGEIRLWRWAMWAKDVPRSKKRNRLCFSVGLDGPLLHLPSGATMGGETGAKNCGPIKAKRGTVAAAPVKAGSITPPRGKEESWPEFDVGIAAYGPSVDHVRLIFSDGESEVLRTRTLPRRLAFKNSESFRYVPFAVTGCIGKLEGLTKGKVVARLSEPKCS